MSADTHIEHHADGHHEGDAIGHGSRRGYLIGFGLAVVLTVIPFWLVMGNVLDSALATAILVMALALVQVVVHMIYFLHVNARAEGGWNIMALIFTVILVVIAISGSIWVMFHLNNNMMPQMTGQQMQGAMSGGNGQ
ncbi:cytochrome o ubiquinol oxidase subunit IV [Pararhizobium mangrovi]|uniref:Cytochrome bo(3) ubiquinol oxidase subunit 4 n=1 Tax=Pararhizobium mangrovi TaxID=2590452 RepID=A0A506U1G3_9HYPH|nr:cytochrome o ubiquinol oxidase subunit IV [Pararhizobium mangrovi]TPW26834.1 cytochrome o ubiquinol oxidase subunit IV [Pararhizobium mangrovi]